MKAAAVVLFFALLALPMVQSATGWAPALAIDENRTLAPWPKPAALADPPAWFAAAQAWFDDRFGLRDLLIRLKTQIDYSVFDTSTRVHIGKDGWLFYRSTLDVEKPAVERLLAADGDRIAAGIQALARRLRARDVRLVLLPVLLGDVFYADRLPADVPALPQPSRFARESERWRSLPDVLTIDAAAVLRGVQPIRQTFQRTDFHWNGPAAFEVARVVVDTLAAEHGITPPLWDHRPAYHRGFFIGKESAFLPLFVQPSEMTLFTDRTWPEDDFSVTIDQGIFESIATNRHPGPRTLPALCVLGDSFFDGMQEAGMARYFARLYRVRWKDAGSLDALLARLPTDCRTLMVEFIEVNMAAMAALGDQAR